MRRAAWIVPVALAAACGAEPAPAPGGAAPASPQSASAERASESGPFFVEATERVGLAGFPHYRGFTPDRYLIETVGGGLAWLDYDLDGRVDLYQVQSAPVAGVLEGEIDGAEAPAETPRNRLFRAEEDGRFRERGAEAGVDDPSFGIGCAVGDADGDGDPDLYVTNYGPNVFYRNGGDGRFADDTAAAGIGGRGWSVSAGFFDAERDGDLDLYVVEYLVFSEALQRDVYARAGVELGRAYPHPDRFDGAEDRYYRNDGSGHFEDALAEAGFDVPVPGKGLGVAFADVEGDGDVDVYVANDSTPNFLFVNDGAGRFAERAAEVGCAFNRDGVSEASMGVGFGDADGDGLPDLFMTHLDLETNTYYANCSTPDFLEFRDRTLQAGLAVSSYPVTGFGAGFLDYDSDGCLDLFAANGGLHDNIAVLFPERAYTQGDHLLRGRCDGTFEDVSDRAGPYFQRAMVGRGVAFADFDRDGDTDIAVGNSGDELVLLENRATGGRHWLRFRLVGGEGNPRDGQGARVALAAGGRVHVREAWTGYSYASASEPWVHFGLGAVDEVESLEVRWPSGLVERWDVPEVDRHYELRQGAPEVVALP